MTFVMPLSYASPQRPQKAHTGKRDFAGTFAYQIGKVGKGENIMELKKLDYDLTVCKLTDTQGLDLNREFYFIGRTDEELSLVCKTEDTPEHTTARDDGWRGFRIQGILDFSLIGILARISGILAEQHIGIFAVSTFNTDYILVKKENFESALQALACAGYTVV